MNKTKKKIRLEINEEMLCDIVTYLVLQKVTLSNCCSSESTKKMIQSHIKKIGKCLYFLEKARGKKMIKLNVGDPVVAYYLTDNPIHVEKYIGFIRSMNIDGIVEIEKKNGETVLVHRKQCSRLNPKKPKVIFRIGDKVLIIDRTRLHYAREGFIKEISRKEKYPFNVSFDDHDGDYGWYASHQFLRIEESATSQSEEKKETILGIDRAEGKDETVYQIVKPKIKTSPFNLEAALRGEPVVTQDGGIFELLNIYKDSTGEFYILGNVRWPHAEKYIREARWLLNGKWSSGDPHINDLFMAPTKKKTFWVNLYCNIHGEIELGRPHKSVMAATVCGSWRTDAEKIKTISFEVEE